MTQSVIPAHSVSGFFAPVCTSLFLVSWFSHYRLDSVGHSGPLGLWQSHLSLLLLPFSLLFHFSLHPVGHSGPLGYWLPPTSCPLSFSLDSFLSKPPPSRSFRPTRLLASHRTFLLLLVHLSVHLVPHSVIALSVIPAHTAIDFFFTMTTSRTKFPPDPETWMQITPTCQEIYDRSIPFPPVAPGYNIFPTCMIDKSDPCLQIQHEWDATRITNLMSALPHFDIPARTDDPSPLPWRVLWPYHPVIETFGQAKCQLPDNNPFFYLHDLIETDPAFAGIIPDTLDKNSDFIVINPVQRVVIFHRVAQARHKCAVFLASRVEGELAPYFQSLWHRNENTPLPTTDPTFYSTIIPIRLQQAYDILTGVGRPMHRTAWADYRTKHYIECEEYTGTTVATRPPPPVLSDPAAFPTMEAAATVPNPARSRLAPLPKKGSSPITHSYAAEAPVSTITSSPSAPSTPGLSSALPLAPPMPVAAPASLQPAGFSHAPSPAPAPPSTLFTGGLALPPDELMPQVTTAHLEQGGIPIEKGVKLTSLRPIIHPPVQPRCPIRGLPAPTEPPPLHQIFAEAFSRLPPMAGFCQTGRDLYNFLFSGTPPTPPTETTLDDPMGADPPPASTDGGPNKSGLSKEHEVTIFSKMVDDCIDIPKSFDDPHRLSAPEIQGSENQLLPLTIPPPTRPSFAILVQHVHEQLDSYLATQQTDGKLNAFITFIVGPPDHPNARYALHSHLVGCHTTFNGDMHVDYSTIYIPCGPGHPWAGPSEWGPLMVFLAAALLWPDLPFLVCHPRFLLGAHAPLDELREVFSTNCPMVLFSSARDLTRSDVLYHPGKTTKFAHDLPFSCSDPPFTRNPPDLVQNLISSSVNAHAAAAPANRERLERLASPSIEADLHFPLLCTPYYGFVPETEVDLFVEILQLSSFLCSCCFANDGNDIPHLGDSAPTAAALLSTLSAIPNERSGGSIAAFPGTGVFICDPAPAPQNGDPAIACWLYIPASLPPPPPTVFCTLIATLSPSDPRFATPLFETYSTAPGSRTGIPLGSHVCVHLNASLLPTPFLGQSESLQYLPVARGGIGASQYFHSFSTSGKQEPLSTITLDAHPLPIDFTDQLFQYENWPSADNLLIEATQTAPDSKDFYLSLWCPEEAAHLSPDHSITVCNQHAGNSFPVHGASFAPTDYHTQIEGRSVWECSHTHNPGGEHLASLLPQLCTYWPAFLDGVGVQLSNFKEFIEQAYRTATFATRPGVAAWRFPPHSLTTNTFRLLFSLFATPGILIEGFGAGTSFSAAAGLIALTRGQFASVLLCLGGVAMHPPTFCKLLRSYTFFYERDHKLHQDFLEEKRPDKKTRPPNYRPQHSAVEPQHGFLIVQHLHDRRAPWALTPLILSHLYNKGISVLTLHDDLAAQRAHAEKFGKDFRPRSHWGRYRHNYEDLVPTLKTFGASTFFSNFCRPLTWEQLEAREGTLGVSYSPDLLDLFFAFLSYHGTLPLPFFRATPDALEKVLLQGCYRPPGALAGLFHISQEPHETPANFYTRAFLLPLRFPCLTTLGLPPPDIFAIESAVRQELLRVPLPQALDFLHSQILAILCVNAPRRPKGSQKIHSIDPCPPTACYLVFPERATAGVPDPPQFRCWISRRVAPNMAVIGLKCNSTPWACSYVDGTSGNLFVGFTPGNFIQLAFPTDDERFPPQKGSNASHFAFALYITSTSGNKGRVGEELPTEQKDTGPTYVTAINGILLPFLLRHKLRPAPSSSAATSTLFQIGLPLFPREDSLAEALELPPLSMEHSFYMPVSAIRGLFSQLLTVPLYRQPNTLGWPYLDAPIDPGDQWSSDTFLPLRNLLMLLPNFMPSAVQELLQTFQINGTHFYNLSALTHLREKGILPGTRSDDMSSLYDWPLEWEPKASLDSPFFSSLQNSDAENWQLLRKLGGHFLRRLIAALLAPNGHFPSLLLSTLWGIQGGFTSLCVQGIFGSGKTYCASLLLVLVSTVLQLPTVLTAEPNLPLATAAETISDLLRDAPAESRAAYARVLAYGVPKLTPIDILPIDRPKLFQADSPLMCLILTHGSVLRDLCRDYPQLRSFLEACRLAINDESQQGGHAGFTILATCLARACLQIFTGDREQTRAGTGGDLLRESLLQRLAHKGIGFLDGPPPKLPLEMLASFASALADECSFPPIGTSGPDPFPLLAALTTVPLKDMCLPRAYFCISFFHTLFAVQRMHILLRSLCTTPTSTDPMALELPTATMKNHLDNSGTPACR